MSDKKVKVIPITTSDNLPPVGYFIGFPCDISMQDIGGNIPSLPDLNAELDELLGETR